MSGKPLIYCPLPQLDDARRGPTAAMYDALRTFDRPATRREIERAAGLEKPASEAALRVLAKAGALLRSVDEERYRGLYQLVPGAACPPGRGKYPRR